MPSMPPKPCSNPRCYKMASKGGRCEDHQPEPWFSSKLKTAAERGYGYKWKKLRAKVLIRDAHLCQTCFRAGIITVASEVDHKLNKARGGTDSMDNLESICSPCHKDKTNKERKGK